MATILMNLLKLENKIRNKYPAKQIFLFSNEVLKSLMLSMTKTERDIKTLTSYFSINNEKMEKK